MGYNNRADSNPYTVYRILHCISYAASIYMFELLVVFHIAITIMSIINVSSLICISRNKIIQTLNILFTYIFSDTLYKRTCLYRTNGPVQRSRGRSTSGFASSGQGLSRA